MTPDPSNPLTEPQTEKTDPAYDGEGREAVSVQKSLHAL
jgi:hypothetical protein